MLQQIKKITSHAGYGRWLAECSEAPIGYLARAHVTIPSPYRYSPSVAIYTWKDKQVVSFETAHKVYKVFEVPADMPRYETDEEATIEHVAALKRRNPY